MHKKWRQRCYAWLLTGALAVSALPLAALTAQAAAGQEEAKQAQENVLENAGKAAADDMGGYLWLNFGTEGGYEKIFYGYSEDGLTWKKLNKVNGTSRSVLVNNAKGSDLGVRDPHIIRSPQGDKYWILGTDLHAEGGGTGGSGWNQLSASQNLVIWESSDLVNWSEPRLVHAGFDNAGCIWAPEAIYDDTTEDYVVYWSARDKSKEGTDDNALRVYVCRTKDFITFTEPKVWLSEDAASGNEVNIIDTTIVKGEDGKFYRFSTSDWITIIDVSDTLDTEDVLDVRNGEAQSTPKGSWKRLVTRSGSSAAGFVRCEGLTVYQLPDGQWCAMGDDSGYKAFLTDDLASGEFTLSSSASFPDGKFRHGTVMRLTAEEDARVREAFKDRETEQETSSQEPVLTYDFEEDMGSRIITDSAAGNSTEDNARLWGNAEVVYDEERESNVLKLDGSAHTYAELPMGFFDKRDTMTISMDVKSDGSSGNFFTFAFGKDDQKYDFLRVRGTQVRNALTTTSYNSEQEVKGTGASTGQWQNIAIVIDGSVMKLYIDGKLASVNEDTGITITDLGTDLLAYFGKSFYSPDGYFAGSFDNIKVYNCVRSENDIKDEAWRTASMIKGAVIGKLSEEPLDLRGTDDHTAVFSRIKGKEIVSYVRKDTDLSAVPVTLSLFDENVIVTADGKPFTGGNLDLCKDVELKTEFAGRTQTYTIKKPLIAGNPVLPGQYADPDIDYFDGKFWIYPTTDGYPGWSGTKFHAFSSIDMVNWEDEGIILELANDAPGLNDKGVQIAASPWAVDGSAWAPTIEKKNDKYYFYYCGKKSGGESAIGVAVADKPAGPYTDMEEPLMTVAMCTEAGVDMGQAIDPSIFTDDDGTSYILFGNGHGAIAELNEDMVSIKEGTLKQINGLTGFRESVIVTKVNGKYHWTWTDDDANSPNYHVNYGVSDKLIGEDGKVNVTLKKKNLLSKNESLGLLGTGHQSVLHVQDADGKERYFMAYHRFYTPLDIFTDAFGVHRETCIDEIFFDENGEMEIAPTLDGTGAVHMWKVSLNKPSLELAVGKTETLQAALTGESNWNQGLVWSSDNPAVATVDQKGFVTAKMAGTANISVTASNGSQAVCVVTVKSASGGDVSPGKPDNSGNPNNPNNSDNLVKVSSVALDKKKLTLGVREEFLLKATVSPNNASNPAVTWKVDKPKIVQISKSGLVKGLKKGTATITATADGKTAKCTITVKAAPKKISLNAKKKTLKKGKSFQLKVKLPKNTASNKITYSSSKKKVASVSAKGTIKALKKGKAVITAKTFNGKKAKITVIVK